MHNFAQRDVVEVAVNKPRARLITQRFTVQMLHRFGVTRPALSQIKIGRKAGGVRQQLFDGDRIAALAFYLGNEFHYRIGQAQLATLDQNHDAGGGGDNLSQASQVENRVRRHRFSLRLNRARAVSFPPDNATAASDQHDRSGQFFLVDRSLNDGIHAGETFGRHADGGRLRRRQLDGESLARKGEN